MFKKEVQGHGSIKKLRTGAVVSVLTLSVLGGVSVVSADETTSANTTAGNVEVVAKDAKAETAPVAKTTEAKVETVTGQQVADAKVVANQANQALTAQGEVVASAETAVTENNNTVTDLGNQITEVEKITPEVVAEAKSDQAKAKETLDQATTATTSVEKSLTDATTKEATQKGVVAKAESNVEKTASAVADAEKKVEALSATTDTAKLNQDVKDLTAKVTEDTTNVKSAKDSLDAAKLSVTNKEQAIKDQKSVVATAEGTLSNSSKAYDTAKGIQEGTQATETSAKSALDEAKKGKVVVEPVKVGEVTSVTADGVSLNKGVAYSNFLETNGIVVNQEYLDAIKALARGTGSVQAVKDAIKKGDKYGFSLDAVSGPASFSYKSWVKNRDFTFANTDATTKLDVNNLSDSQLTDLALFYTALLNDVRFKVGTNLVTVTEQSVAEAKKVVTSIFNKVFPSYKGMNNAQLEANGFWNSLSQPSNPLRGPVYDVTNAVKGVDSEDTTIIGQEPANNVNYDNIDGRKQTMAELKAKIFANLGNQLFGFEGQGYLGEASGGVDGKRSENFDLAMTVLGLKGTSTTAGVDLGFMDLYQGMVDRAPKTYTVLGNAYGKAISNPYQTLKNPKETITPVYKDVERTVVDDVAVAKAQTNYDAAVKANQDAKSKVATAESVYNTAKEALANAQKRLADLVGGTVDIPALEKALADAKTQLESDQASLQGAKESLALAKASATDKAKALEVAKTKLAEATKSSETAKGVLAKEKETLEILAKAVAVAQAALTDARTKQDVAKTKFITASVKAEDLATKLANKSTVLADLNSKLADAKAKSIKLVAELNTAKERYETLKKDSNVKNVEYLRLATLKAEQDKAEAEVARLQALKDKADSIVANGGVVVQVVDADGNVVDVVDGTKAVKNADGSIAIGGKQYALNNDGTVSRVVVPTADKGVLTTSVVKQAGVAQVGDKITYTRVNRANSLPNTGSQESLLGLLGASMIAGLGLGYVGKRKRKN
ncbi:LPXTG cell wall anchor domain-containing protein [Streptococcus vestibularis]|uniref:LPXTG cell wall anchor domain-containing protein n=1 Tax=Streptococcus vestibularis TaxID=1343 RepID=UPI000E449959|nr:SEC10/PgrA surface exclusion domain-containing protein [Streptococcus vestibularis]RGM53499.1 SEC10/PgrA surface exclusion domain-containing protein [Streptococcus vestibularis]